MGRAVGSTAAHEALNQRMRAMMGDQGESRMHQLMDARYVNCPLPGTANNSGYGYGRMMGPGMMGGNYSNDGWGPMMSSGDWNWMMGGAWQNMSRQDWQRLQQQLLGTNTSNTHNGTSGWMIAAIALAALLLGAAIALLAVRYRPSKRPPASARPA